MTFKAKVSGLSAFRHSTTVENSPSPNLRSTSYGPTHVSVSSFSAATDGGSASCWAHVLSRSVGLPVACSARGRIFLRMVAMLVAQGAGIACTGSPGGVPGPFPAWCDSWRPGRARWRRAGGPVRTQRVAEFGCAQVKVKTTVRITGGVLAT